MRILIWKCDALSDPDSYREKCWYCCCL